MHNNEANSVNALGFLTVLDHPEHGLFGGYLVLNTFGRPLEFHCTAPIKANRAQQILYGPTLESFLYGEQIGSTLLGKAATKPSFVCTDHVAALAVREHVSLPVVLVLGAPDAPKAEQGDQQLRLDSGHGNGPRLAHFQLGDNRLAVAKGSAEDQQRIIEHFEKLDESFDLAEPFTRIRAAIEEARQAVR